MIIKNLRVIAGADQRRIAWSGLSRFQNTSHTSDIIESLHHISNNQRKNIKKQAEQIRYCLIQANEYFDAAQSVSISTKPVLMYYGLMSLALAEILLKQDGDSSLDRARGQHAHHGLDFKLDGNPSLIRPLSGSAAILRAVPLDKSGQRFGTFELWHRKSWLRSSEQALGDDR